MTSPETWSVHPKSSCELPENSSPSCSSVSTGPTWGKGVTDADRPKETRLSDLKSLVGTKTPYNSVSVTWWIDSQGKELSCKRKLFKTLRKFWIFFVILTLVTLPVVPFPVPQTLYFRDGLGSRVAVTLLSVLSNTWRSGRTKTVGPVFFDGPPRSPLSYFQQTFRLLVYYNQDQVFMMSGVNIWSSSVPF